MTFEKLFADIFEKNGLEAYITRENIEKFASLTEIMINTNKVMNITALTTIDKIIPLHYADCVKIAGYIPKNARVIDVGCGGGFPVLPLAIVRPDLTIEGLDSTDKKVRYVQNTADALGLHIETISARAEDAAKIPHLRDSFDIAISRAVARLNVLDELCLPFVRVGGKFISMKGVGGMEEAEEAKNGIKRLKGSIEKIEEYELFAMNESEKRSLIFVSKNDITPNEYPRSFGAIKKKPL